MPAFQDMTGLQPQTFESDASAVRVGSVLEKDTRLSPARSQFSQFSFSSILILVLIKCFSSAEDSTKTQPHTSPITPRRYLLTYSMEQSPS